MSMDIETDFDGILAHLNEIGCNLLKIVNDVITQANDITLAGRDLTLEGYLDDAATSLVKVHDNLKKAREYVQEQKKLREFREWDGPKKRICFTSRTYDTREEAFEYLEGTFGDYRQTAVQFKGEGGLWWAVACEVHC